MDTQTADDRFLRSTTRALAAPIALLTRIERATVEIAARGVLDPEALRRAGVTAADLAVDEIALVPDLGADPRFAGGPWARAVPAAVALAVAPLVGGDGTRLGALVVMDTRPRAWTGAEREALADLAAQAAETTSLRRSDELFRAAVHSYTGAALVIVGRDRRLLLAGGSFTPPELEGKLVSETVPPEAAARIEAAHEAALRGEVTVYPLPLQGRTLLSNRGPVRRADGEILASLVVTKDVTAQLAAESALQASEERYRVLFEKAGEAIYILDIDGDGPGTILDLNPAAVALHGYTREEMLGKKVADLIAPGQEQAQRERRRSALGGAWVRGSAVHVRKGGALFQVDATVGTVEIAGTRCFLLILYDVSERQRAEDELREAKHAAEAANRAKSVFLASMSHEIRTPMNAVLGYTQLLERDDRLAPDQRQHLEVIRRAGDHLIELINDVLEMSKIEAGVRRLNPGDLHLGDLIDDILRLFRLRTDAKGLTLDLLREPGVPDDIVADEARLRQVLVNLLGNAVKFTERGGVSVRVEARRDPAGQTKIAVEVADTGPGIEPEMLGKLFRPFVQARAGHEAHGGTGLGLAISREYARLMGGEITVASRAGHGSAFRLEIPVELAAGPTRTRPPSGGRVRGIAGAGEPPRVVIVDDDDDNRSWLRLLLTQIGIDTREARDGEEALACFAAWSPRLVLMDMDMPVMDGFAAMRAIRARPDGAGAILVAVTASAFDEEQGAILAAGADAIVRKPCRESELLETIGRLLGLTYVYGDPPEGRRGPPPPPSAAALALPVEIGEALRRAASMADYGLLLDLLDEIPAEHAAAAAVLRSLVKRYAYEEIEALLASPAAPVTSR